MINSLKGLVAQIATTPLSDDHHDDHHDVDYDGEHNKADCVITINWNLIMYYKLTYFWKRPTFPVWRRLFKQCSLNNIFWGDAVANVGNNGKKSVNRKKLHISICLIDRKRATLDLHQISEPQVCGHSLVELKWGDNQESGKAIILDQQQKTTVYMRIEFTVRIPTTHTYKDSLCVNQGWPEKTKILCKCVIHNYCASQSCHTLVDAIRGSIYGQAVAIRRDDLGMSRPSTHNQLPTILTRLSLTSCTWLKR